VPADLQASLGHVAFEAALYEGRALSLEEAVAYAERGRAKRNRARSGWESLTPSERRVVSLVDQHLTNAQIAERVFISVPTVKSHQHRAFAKLEDESKRHHGHEQDEEGKDDKQDDPGIGGTNRSLPPAAELAKAPVGAVLPPRARQGCTRRCQVVGTARR
jgi:DNA-binding CsgD family transcriptional regulator